MGKGNWDETDHRSNRVPDEWITVGVHEDIVLDILNENSH